MILAVTTPQHMLKVVPSCLDDELTISQAAGQRMNTDARRAVFCAVMGAEDCMDAFERLLKLQLKARGY